MPTVLTTALSLAFCLLHACGLAWLLVLGVALLGHVWLGGGGNGPLICHLC